MIGSFPKSTQSHNSYGTYENVLGTFSCKDMIVTLSDDIIAIEPLWRNLLTRCQTTIYQHYLWQKAWFETIGTMEGGKALFIIGHIENQAVMLIPLIVLKKGGLTIATWMGGDHANYRFGLFSADHVSRLSHLMPMLLSELKENLPYPLDALDLPQQPLVWDNVPNPVAKLPHIPSAVSGGSVTLGTNFQTTLGRGNGKRKRKILRAQERSLEALGGYTITRTKLAKDTQALYRIFLKQKNEWFAERGINNPFNNEAACAFFDRLAIYNEGQPDDEKLLEFDYVLADGKELSLIAGGVFKGQHFGYFTSMSNDQKYRSISPGSLTFYKRIEAACAEGLRRFDFGVGAERYKVSWCDENHALVDVIIPISPKGRLYVASRKLKSSMKRQIKENEMIWRFAKKVRQAIGLRKH